MIADVAGRIDGTVYGREATGGAVETAVAEAAVDQCCEIAPGAPEAILREAATRYAGWLFGSRPNVASEAVKDPSGTELTLDFLTGQATANGFRASGASALLSRWITRRAGVIG